MPDDIEIPPPTWGATAGQAAQGEHRPARSRLLPFFMQGTPESMSRLLAFMSVATGCLVAIVGSIIALARGATTVPEGLTLLVGTLLAGGIPGLKMRKSSPPEPREARDGE